MTLDDAKQTALSRAQRSGQRCYVVSVDGDCEALTRDEIMSYGLGMAQSPSPVVGYYDSTAATLGDFKAQ